MPPFRPVVPGVVRWLGRTAAVGAAATLGALALGTAPATAAELVVTPLEVAPQGTVTVEGRCPESARDPYLSATLGIEKLGRYVRVDVREGAFRGLLTLEPAGDLRAPLPGTAVALQASCRTETGFVASAGTEKVEIVEVTDVAVPVVAPSSPRVSVGAVAPRPVQTTAAQSGNGGSPSLVVPFGAFLVAVLGSVGAYLHHRRTNDRATAMVGHPAQRGVGRPPRRDRR